MDHKRDDYPPNVLRFVSKYAPDGSTAEDAAFWKAFRKAANAYVAYNATLSEDSEKRIVEPGPYVLATKYSDGDPMDHFCVGFVTGKTHHGRYDVVDGEGKLFRKNGFRRAEEITQEEGNLLVKMFPEIGDRRGPSLWWHLAKIRGEESPIDPCGIINTEVGGTEEGGSA